MQKALKGVHENHMISEIEEKFIRQFIIKEKRDRLFYELNGKKRQHGIGRFCHNAQKLLINKMVIASGDDIFPDMITSMVEKYNVTGNWYIIAYNQELDRKTFPLQEALQHTLENGMAAILISDTMAIVETEQCDGTPARYILHC